MKGWLQCSHRNRCRICGADHRCSYTTDGHVSKCCNVLDAPGATGLGCDDVGEFALYFADAPDGRGTRRTPPPAPPPVPVAPVAERHRVYTALLSVLTLSVAHRHALIRRGLTPSDIDRADYKTLPPVGDRAQVVKALRHELGGTIANDIPGLDYSRTTNPDIKLLGPSGVLIPVRDHQGQIQALKVRCDDPARGKYLWLSSTSAEGPSPGAPCHLAPHPEAPHFTVRVTEGPLKADVATALSALSTLGIPGVTTYRAAMPLLRELKAHTVVLAWDADARKKTAHVNFVASSLESFALLLAAEGIAVEVETWPTDDQHAPKGIDDALLAQAPITVHRGQEAWRIIQDTVTAAGIKPKAETVARAEGAQAEPSPTSPTPPTIHPASADGADDSRSWADGINSELGHAEMMITTYGGDLRFCPDFGRWLVWDGSRWEKDERGTIFRYATATMRAVHREIMERVPDGDGRAYGIALKAAAKTQTRAHVSAVVGFATTDKRAVVLARELDADPWAFACANGTLDVRTGRLRSARRTDLITKRSPVAWDEDARAPSWEAFLAEAQPERAIRDFLQRLMGYCLTGVIREHIFPINHGGGRNGKGTFANAIMRMMGDYAAQVPTELLMMKQGEAHPAERAMLMGLRFASASETEEGRPFNVALIKQLTGGDPISARFMRENFFTFMPTHKLWVSVNPAPVVREMTVAIWSRLILIPWGVSFAGREDTGLGDRLAAEAPGILRWAAEGALAWQDGGLQVPDLVRAATQSLRDENDVVGLFLAERCEIDPTQSVKTSARDVFNAYKAWASARGGRVMSETAFGTRLVQREARFEKRKYGGTMMLWGLRVLTGEEIAARAVDAAGAVAAGSMSGNVRDFDANTGESLGRAGEGLDHSPIGSDARVRTHTHTYIKTARAYTHEGVSPAKPSTLPNPPLSVHGEGHNDEFSGEYESDGLYVEA